jgi:hypothetical protein
MIKFISYRLKPIILLIMALFIIAIYFWGNPIENKWFPACPFFNLTGFYCPGCGGQRAFHAFLHGNFAEAFHDNLLIFIIIPAVLYKILLELKGHLRRDVITIENKWIWIFLSFLVFFTILRNIPVYPFNQLIPYK